MNRYNIFNIQYRSIGQYIYIYYIYTEYMLNVICLMSDHGHDKTILIGTKKETTPADGQTRGK
jgi:3-methyladenine DNA glycosylase Mpg